LTLVARVTRASQRDQVSSEPLGTEGIIRITCFSPAKARIILANRLLTFRLLIRTPFLEKGNIIVPQSEIVYRKYVSILALGNMVLRVTTARTEEAIIYG
jgi:hypothetical protein